MSIVKSKHASNYTVLPNEIFTSGLSIEAIGLLSYFLSLPHDWVIYKTQLHTQLNMGRDKVDRIFKELHDKGYLMSVKEFNNKGQFTYNHIIYDKPFNGEPIADKPVTETPHTEKPLTDNLPLQSTNKLSTKQQSKEYKDNMFEIFWNLYDNKKDRFACYNKFVKLDIETINKIIEVVPEYLKTITDKQFQKHPKTWINNKCWNDEYNVSKNTLSLQNAPQGYYYNSQGELRKTQLD
jgi:hypothetical protein